MGNDEFSWLNVAVNMIYMKYVHGDTELRYYYLGYKYI